LDGNGICVRGLRGGGWVWEKYKRSITWGSAIHAQLGVDRVVSPSPIPSYLTAFRPYQFTSFGSHWGVNGLGVLSDLKFISGPSFALKDSMELFHCLPNNKIIKGV
jgi:hypothetical protein